MSGTAAPDPRIAAVARCISTYERPDYFDRQNAREVLMEADAADRAAGVIRVRTDDATVEKIARQLHQQDAYEIHNDWDDLSDYRRDAFRDRARGILEALVTP